MELKYSPALRFSQIQAVNKTQEIKSLLLRVNASTGWKFPDSKEMVNALVHEFSMYIDEQCSDLKPDEIAYAVRTHGVTIKEWGKNLNIALIDQCIALYRSKRYEASQEEERAAIEQEVPKIELTDSVMSDWSSFWEKLLQSAKNGVIRNEFISTYFYDWLLGKFGFNPTPVEKVEAFREAAQIYRHEIEQAIITGGYAGLDPLPEIRRRLDILNRDIYEEIVRDKALKAAITNSAKSLLIKRYAVSQITEKNGQNSK